VRLAAREARWLSAQQHYGENTGQSDTHAIFVELKDPGDGAATGSARLGPAMP
jgi:beta-alanine degradation protein BauB